MQNRLWVFPLWEWPVLRTRSQQARPRKGDPEMPGCVRVQLRKFSSRRMYWEVHLAEIQTIFSHSALPVMKPIWIPSCLTPVSASPLVAPHQTLIHSCSLRGEKEKTKQNKTKLLSRSYITIWKPLVICIRYFVFFLVDHRFVPNGHICQIKDL